MKKENLKERNDELKKTKSELKKLTYKREKTKNEIRCHSCGEIITSRSVIKCPNCGNYVRGNLPSDIIRPGDIEALDFDENYTYDDYVFETVMDEMDHAESRRREKMRKIAELKVKIQDLKKKIRSEKYKILINFFCIIAFASSFLGLYLLRFNVKEWGDILSPWLIIPFFLCVYYGLYWGLFTIVQYFFDNKIAGYVRIFSAYISVGSFLFIIIGLPLGLGILAIISNIMD